MPSPADCMISTSSGAVFLRRYLGSGPTSGTGGLDLVLRELADALDRERPLARIE